MVKYALFGHILLKSAGTLPIWFESWNGVLGPVSWPGLSGVSG